MKKTFLLLFLFAVQVGIFAQEEYYPEGTKWTEIRLDTLKYDSWYSKVDGEWVPNFETIEYYVQGEYVDRNGETYRCVYTNGPEWSDSLTLLVRERMYENIVEVNVPLFYEDNWGTLLELPCSAEIYQFEWSVGKRLWFQDISGANATCYPPCGLYNYGMIDEIEEGNFGGVRPLKYVDLNGKAPVDPEQPWLDYTDTNGGRIIQGIGITEWNDGECLFGPVNPYRALQQFDSDGWYKYPWRNYRSMLVHFERDNEVLYDVWPEKPYQPLPFLEGNPIWVYKHEHLPMGTVLEDDGLNAISCWLDAGNRNFTYYFLGGQKEIEGKVYTMMGAVGCNRDGEITLNHWLPVREENGIVYAFTDSLPGIIETEDNYDSRYNDEYNPMPYLQQGNECVLYNFSTNIGETLYPQNEGSTVKSFDTYQLLDGTECRVLKTNWGRYDLYEKLGFLSDDFDGIMDPFLSWPLPTDGSVHSSRLNAYYQDNVMLYKAPNAQGGLCVNDTIWTRDDAEAYASSYKANPYHEEVMSYIRRLQKANEPVTYFPEGTKWTEIRLDTLKYNSWYSKVGEDWVPNFETIEYRVLGIYSNFSETFGDNSLKCVYTNCSEWTDSLSLLIVEGKINEYLNYGRRVMATVPIYFDSWDVPSPAMAYNFDWRVGMPISFIDILSTTYDHNSETAVFGIIEEINEGNFGGVRPLSYTDVNGVRFIQGIGVTTWNDGECIFGPVKPYEALSAYGAIEPEGRHYRSMLVHFERNDEVLYDVWPEKETIMGDPVTYTAGQMATIILPTTPDASKGKYYRLDRYEDGQIIFEQELQPQAHVPYIIVPNEDFCIAPGTLDLEGCYRDTVSIAGISFIGSYVSKTFDYQEGFYIEIIDTTPDCRYDESCVIGALRAYLLVHWDDPYNQGGTKVPPLERLEIVLRDDGTGIKSIDNGQLIMDNSVYDLSGRKIINGKLPQGIYIEEGKKRVAK